MEYRTLGNSGLQVSLVGIGCNNFGGRIDLEATRAVIDKAIDVGINFFDTADVYGGQGKSEELMGQVLEGRRDQVVIATKFAMKMGDGPMMSGGSRRYIFQAVEASLRRLRTDYIDLYQMHSPDPKTPIEETMEALDDLVTAGKVRYIGHSNFSGWQTTEAHYISRARRTAPFISAQNEYSLINRKVEAELVPASKKFDVSILPYFPLASGLLTGKYKRGEERPSGRLQSGPMADRMLTDANFERVEKLTDYAESRGHTILELAMSWLASKPEIGSVIAGATKPEQVEANANSVGWKLTAEEMAEVNAI